MVAAGIVRAIFINHLINQTYDNTWYLWKFWLWSFVELYLAIIAASAPALKPFFRRFLVDPISSRKGNSSYARDRHHKAQTPEARARLWSNDSSTVKGGEYDIEKIGMAVGGDGTKRYELQTLKSGKVEPVQIHIQPERSTDLRPTTTASSVNDDVHGGWVLPPTEAADDTCPLRTYRAEIEALPPVPGKSRKNSVSGYGGSRQGNRSVTPEHRTRGGPLSSHTHSSSIPQYGSFEEPVEESDWTHNLNRRASQGSVKAARLRAESIKKQDAIAAARRRAAARAKERSANPNHNFDHDESDVEGVASDSSSSDETMGLPKQGAVDHHASMDFDQQSLHLPRQGSMDDMGYGRSRVGVAV